MVFDLKKRPILVFDVETDSLNPETAKLKWFGCYSYLHNQTFILKFPEQKKEIEDLLKEHRILVGFNNKEYDFPILENNLQCQLFKQQIDLLTVSRQRLANMGVRVKDYSLRTIIKDLQLPQGEKGEIDFHIFQKDEWTEEEVEEIKKYLRQDVNITKDLFEYYNLVFSSVVPMLTNEDQEKLMHIKASPASLSYRAILSSAGIKYEFSDMDTRDETGKRISYEGAHHIEPRWEKVKGNIVSIDFVSFYPHMILMNNLLSPKKNGYSGSGYLKLKGSYDNVKQGKIELALKKILLERLEAKKNKNIHKNLSYKLLINCFSDDTEILTESGIKLISDCSIGEKVYSINPITHKTELKEITNLYEQEYTGDMIHFKDSSKDLLVTPNHDMLVERKNKIEKISAEKFLDGYYGCFPKSYKISGIKNKFIDMKQFTNEKTIYKIKLDNPYLTINRKNINLKYDHNTRAQISLLGYDKKLKGQWFIQSQKRDMLISRFLKTKDLFYLIGIFLAEGTLNVSKLKHYDNGNYRGTAYISAIAQDLFKNPVICSKIKNCLDNLNIRYSHTKTVFTISSKFWYDFFSAFKKNSFDCHIPEWVFKYDASLLKYLYEGLYDGDGTKLRNRYTTVSDKLKDDVIKLNLHLGYRSHYTISKYQTKTTKKNNQVYYIYRNLENSYYKKYSTKIIKNVSNKIVCLTVADNHTVMAGRNGKFIWTGQSFYGGLGNNCFKTTYSPIAAGDVTGAARIILKRLAQTLEKNGFKILYGFTDNVMVLIPPESSKQELMLVADEFIKDVQNHVPFPQETFKLDVDKEMKFIWFVAKNCYLFVDSKDKVHFTTTLLNKNTPDVIMKLFYDYMVPKIIQELDIDFTDKELSKELLKILENNLDLAAEEFSVQPMETYKVKTSMQYQISAKYGEGKHKLIPNSKGVGVGKSKNSKVKLGVRYCTIEEFKNAHLTIKNIDVKKLLDSLKPFIKKSIKKQVIQEKLC